MATDVEVETPSVLGMSDDDFLNQPFDELVAVEETPENSVEGAAEAEDTEDAPTEVSAPVENSTEGASEEESEDDNGADDAATDDDEEASDDDDENTDDETDDSDDTAVDYEAEYKRLTAPFRANNKEMQVKNVDDALKLMKMGVNYNKKMHHLKPHLKVVKMLENNGLLDEGKLSFLIDVSKNNPEAITKLVKDSGINPLDIDVKQEGTEYEPGTYTVNDAEIELDAVLSDIKDTPKFQETLSIISTKLDEPSKKFLAEDPNIIRTLNEHVELGIYDKIMGEVEQERVFGRLAGLSDLQAYKVVGDAINARGGFDKPKAPSTSDANKPEKTTKPKGKDKRKAASHTKVATKTATKEPEVNPLAMSDEEFEKQFDSKYI